jgi:hypothetical protein
MAGEGDPAVNDFEPFTDDELTALALGADADAPVGDDAVDVWEPLGPTTPSPLPSWYMPAPMGVRRLEGWHRHVVRFGAVSVVTSFVVINACGLCNTYGQLHL